MSRYSILPDCSNQISRVANGDKQIFFQLLYLPFAALMYLMAFSSWTVIAYNDQTGVILGEKMIFSSILDLQSSNFKLKNTRNLLG